MSTRSCDIHFECHQLLDILYCMVEIKIQTYIAAPRRDPLSLDTKLEGPSVAILDFYFPSSMPLDDFKGP